MSMARTIETFKDCILVTYAALGSENGLAFDAWQFPDKTIQAFGTGTVTIEGSPDGTNWEPLKTTAGVALSLVSANNEAAVILENPRFMRAVNDNAAGALVVITGVR